MFGILLRRFSPVVRRASVRGEKAYSKKTNLEILLPKLKLGRHQSFRNVKRSGQYLEVLKNNHEELDTVHVRIRQPQVLFLRIELLLQRIRYLEPLGLTPRQKRKLVEKSPPTMVLDFDPEVNEGGQVSYIRGVVRQDTDIVHILHPCPLMVVMRAFDLKNQVSLIQAQLGMAQQTALRLLLNMPCFLLHGREKMSERFQSIHKFSLPVGFSLDYHTAELHPPVYNHRLGVNRRVFTTGASDELVNSIPTLTLSDVLDYSYPEHNGKGKPEDLVEFLAHAERRELRPRYNKVM
ncbi:uncharacterized protein LOC116603514 [Nematostella vectensis]|uniref:uncharacterized protein LOC116603514 n=1 Tax=Nematostella vectensis TaxID=45351 RepID=UPI00138FFC80|nr:uncharacterized protein LOC116603514 [Nematostella vectensis]